MLLEESLWIKKELGILGQNASKLLNFGSSTAYFRKVEQPIIDENIFAPLERNQIKVFHLDIKSSEGVDFVGDVFKDKQLYEKIKFEKINSVLCSNLLEHVEDPVPYFQILEDLVAENGYIILTVPFIYPYHPDPIDTKYRPTIEELVNSFKSVELIKGEYVVSHESFFRFLIKKPKVLIITFTRFFMPFYKFNSWLNIVKDFKILFRKFETTCVVLKVIKKG